MLCMRPMCRRLMPRRPKMTFEVEGLHVREQGIPARVVIRATRCPIFVAWNAKVVLKRSKRCKLYSAAWASLIQSVTGVEHVFQVINSPVIELDIG